MATRLLPRGGDEDERLVAAVRAGDDGAFEEIVRRHEKALRAYAGKLLRGSGQDAQDVVQDVFVNAHAALRKPDPRPLALRAWLYRMTRNRAIDVLRRPSSAPSVPIDDAVASDAGRGDPARIAARRARVAAMMSDLAQLPEQQSKALLMRELEGLTHEDVARELGITPKASRMLVVRARDNLVKAESARDAGCDQVREDILVAHDERRRPSERSRRHLGDCPSCRSYKGQLRHVRRGVHALSPGPAILGLLGLANVIGGGSSKAVVAAAGAALVTAGAGVVVLETSVLRPGDPAPRVVPGSKLLFGEKIVRGGKLPPGLVQVEAKIRLPATGRRTSKLVRLRCPAGYVAQAPVPPAEKDYAPEIRGERIENPDDLGRATYVDWRIFYGARRFKPREIVRDIGLVCRERQPG